MDENEFYRQATLQILSSLDLSKAAGRCFSYLSLVMPVDWMSLHLYQADLASVRTLVIATKEGSKAVDILTPIPPEAREFIVKNLHAGNVKTYLRSDPDPVFTLILDIFGQQFQRKRPTSGIVLPLILESQDIGSLAIITEGDIAHTEEHTQLVSLLREPFAIALSNALQHEEVLRLTDRLADDNRQLQGEVKRLSGDRLTGSEVGLKEVMKKAAQVAHLSSPVLLLGETGVGKEIVANAIHNRSMRREGPFIRVNCGAIAETLVDSELFGHEKGAFTGAVSLKRGIFERADKGTVFLDEIGELSLQAQVKMLRVLQHKEFERVGGSGPVKVDIRIIAATHRNLEDMVKEGTFREDLWFRLNVFPIVIPPLRERKSDIPALVHHFINRKSNELGVKNPPRLSPGAIDRLMSYDWPGNVRELENIVERELIVTKEGEPLSFDNLLPHKETRETVVQSSGNESLLLDDAMASHIKYVLDLTKGKVHGKGGAAEVLGINASTLRARMRNLGIFFGRRRKSTL
ncbi:MAG: sigma-54 interaction domain-containing protein [Nitrospirota bacterium]